MRIFEGHKGSSANDEIELAAIDEPGPGGACHHYRAVYPRISPGEKATVVDFNFQNGPIPEVGVNGITEEVLLAILIDRLEGHQSGKFKCGSNTIALNHLQSALGSLHGRTQDRQDRGVEGTHEV